LQFSNSDTQKTHHSLLNGGLSFLINISTLGLTHHLASTETLYFCIRIALKQADKLGIGTIVIPAINTGKTEMLSYNEAALGTLKAIFDIKHELKCLTKIKIVLKNSEAYKIYNETLDLLSN
jgi:O-acetyl-ADP-ribose deacetylase (regulator of RNase III)